MKRHEIALVTGDGSAPEMMNVACAIAQAAANKDGQILAFTETPMGWNAYNAATESKDTLPPESLKKAVDIGTVFFGGVGDPQFDDTIGAKQPEMKPEARCLLPLRQKMGLLLNFRPVVFYKYLDQIAKVRPENIPEEGVKQIWIRYLLEDTYFGNSEFLESEEWRKVGDVRKFGVMKKSEVTGDEEIVTDMGFYRKASIEKYICAAFKEAQARNLPVISIDKANVMARYAFWRMIVTRIGKDEFPDVHLRHQYVDSANELMYTPAKLHGVIACGNEHGDILSDGAAGALGSMGMMCSSSVNPDSGAAMFESGAGTAPTLARQDKANPIGRILTAAMMLRHLGATGGAEAIEKAVDAVLRSGYRTGDLVSGHQQHVQIVGTSKMGRLILDRVVGNG